MLPPSLTNGFDMLIVIEFSAVYYLRIDHQEKPHLFGINSNVSSYRNVDSATPRVLSHKNNKRTGASSLEKSPFHMR